jgi:hypothetical protein
MYQTIKPINKMVGKNWINKVKKLVDCTGTVALPVVLANQKSYISVASPVGTEYEPIVIR